MCTNTTEISVQPLSCSPYPMYTICKYEVKDAGLTVSFTCETGYVLIGTATLTCNTVTNEWSDAFPTCDACQTLAEPTDGSVTLSSNGITTVATYSCDAGTTLNGDSSRTCRTDSTWTNNAPTCTSCPALSDIASGNVTITTDNTTTTAIHYCAPGYSISGDSTAECTISGSWDSNPPLCQCNDPSIPDNGTVTVSNDRTQAVYTCNLGFTLHGVSKRTCPDDGTGWSSDDPVCVGCPSLIEPGNGSVSLSTNGTLTVANYSCIVGYTMNGDTTSDCQTDGSWSSLAPTCSLCDVVPTVSSASYTLISDGTTTSAKYSCSIGTTISGDVTIACDASGVWTVASGTTSCVECPALSTSGGKFEISTDGTTSTAVLVCESGYTLENGGSIECQSNGTWSSSVESSQCVSTPSSTESNNNDGNLLPAVIALSVLAAAIGTALGLALLYIWKLKKIISGKTDDKKRNENGMNSPMFTSLPPRGHTQHIMDTWNRSSAMSAPMSYVPSPRVDSVTPRSLSSSTSNSSLHLSHLNLIREDTTSSVILDQNNPAPWSIKSKLKHENGPSYSSNPSIFPPISENGTLVTPRGNSSTTQSHTKKKKLSFGKKIQRQNSIEANESEVKNSKYEKENNTESESEKASARSTTKVKRFGSVSKTGGGISNGGSVVPKLKLSEQPQRASTPVKHHMKVKEPDECSTPRSNMFTTVQ
ncbi:P-selectin-like [Ruditapes philippinarum]|uniref:P-selectin-like n=1 Tax=Ruditapes philippinarum TaxID=129788 RepID=UPI00295C17A0|nr:P-selectin-like [Ruditapes philippinarum]